MSYKNNKFQISAPRWNDKFEIPKGSYSVLDIQDYLEYIIRKQEIVTNNSPIRVFVSKYKNKTTFENNTRNYLELLMPKMMKLRGSTKIR